MSTSTTIVRALQSSIRSSSLCTLAAAAHRIPVPTNLLYTSGHRIPTSTSSLFASARNSIPTTTSTRQFHTTLRNMGVHNIRSASEFASTIANNNVVVVDAFAEWCGPCKMISPVVHKWSDEFNSIHFASFDVDDLPELSMELGIRAMPTFLIFKDGRKVDEFVGANPAALLRLIKRYA